MGGFFKASDKNLDNNTTMMYGDYTFSPVPIVSINKEIQKTGDGQSIGTTFSLSLEGDLVPGATGLNGIVNIGEEQDRLMAAFSASGQGYEFKIECGGEDLIRCFPRINSINFEAGQWVDVAKYTIDLEYDRDFATDIGAPWNDNHRSGSGVKEPLISSAEENWSIEQTESNFFHLEIAQTGNNKPTFIDSAPPSFTVTHNVSAVGKPVIVSGVIAAGGYAWQQASGYVIPRLGFDNEKITRNGAMCFDQGGKLIATNQSRTVSFGELDGSYDVTETWTVYSSGIWASGVDSLGASDSWEVNVDTGFESSLTTVSIQGTITGQESGVFCSDNSWGGAGTPTYEIVKGKYENAREYLDSIGDSLFWARAYHFSSGVAQRVLNEEPVSKSFGYNPAQGTITYNYSFNDRPGVCLTGAKTTEISMSDTNATDVFAELVVLGRSSGPVMQSIGTITGKKREVTLDATMPVASLACECLDAIGQMPSTEAETVLLTFRPDNCGGSNLTIFKHLDAENWNPTTGKYSRQMGWTYTTCGS